MIILDATTKSLQFKLGANITTNQLPFAASYIDTTGTVTTPTEQDGVSNNTTAVTIVSAPAASTQRFVKHLVIQNADTAAATVTAIYNNNSTLRNILVVTLAVGDQLIYEDGKGWACLDKNGNLKTAAASALTLGTQNVLNPAAASASNVVAHGLSRKPDFVFAWMECLTANAGYSVGDRLVITSSTQVTSSGAIGISSNATNTYISTDATLPSPEARGGGGTVTITGADWKICAQPVLFNGFTF